MQTEKVLVPLFVGILGVLITSILALVKLVNDKEGKTTDYRQAWTESVRTSFSELISNVNLLANGIVLRLQLKEKHDTALSTEKIKEPEYKFLESIGLVTESKAGKPATGQVNLHHSHEASIKYLTDQLTAEDSYIREQWRSLHRSYALTRLHFKKSDEKFSEVESIFEKIKKKLDDLEKLNPHSEPSPEDARKTIEGLAEQMMIGSRDLLKKEWEIIKKGEQAFKTTKVFAIFFMPVALVALVHLASNISSSPAADTMASANAALRQPSVGQCPCPPSAANRPMARIYPRPASRK